MNSMNWSEISSTGVIPTDKTFLSDSMPLTLLESKIIKEGTEDSQGRPILKITGIFQRANKINANGRLYPKDILEHALGDLEDALKNRRVMGEFDHPPDAKIHMDRVSHLITGLWMEGNKVIGEAEVLENMLPCGANLAALLNAGVTVGISSRGVGYMKSITMNEEEVFEVQEGFSLVTFDTVAEPSVPESYLETMSESRVRKAGLSRRHKESKIMEEMKRYLTN